MGLEIPEVGFLQDLHGLRKEVIVEEIAEPAIHVGLGCADPGHADLAGERLGEGGPARVGRASADDVGAQGVPRGEGRELGPAVAGPSRAQPVCRAGLERNLERAARVR